MPPDADATALVARAEAAEQREARLRAALGEVLTQLEAVEWRPERNVAGGLTDFCPACHRTPRSVAHNRRTQRPDGHRHELDTRGTVHTCWLAVVLDTARAALADGDGETA